MTISTRGRYGLRAMLVLAMRHDVGPVPAHDIARDQGFSVKYLESLLASLKRAGLVIATRGKTGGYVLARPPADITLYDVLKPLEDSLGIVHCTDDNACCARIDTCVTREVWQQIKDETERQLRQTTLRDLRRRQLALWRRARQIRPGTRRAGTQPPLMPPQECDEPRPKRRRRPAT